MTEASMDLTTMTLGDLADLYRDEWDQQEQANEIAREHGRRRDAIKAEIIRRMEDDGLETFKTERISLSLKEEFVPRVTDWEAVQKWIADNGRWEFMRKQLNTGPFKEMIERGEPLPDGLEATALVTLNNRRLK